MLRTRKQAFMEVHVRLFLVFLFILSPGDLHECKYKHTLFTSVLDAFIQVHSDEKTLFSP